MSQATFDIELSLHNFAGAQVTLQRSLGDEYLFEDRTKQGWGLVLRKRDEVRLSLAEAVDSFLKPLAAVQSLIADCEPTLRLAVFNPNVTCTVLLPRLDQIAALGAKLEVSVYPADDDQ
ncbi:hypothetical protein [Hydrocarboniphaga daqingensis]|uniref:hypothetical protein n=1 Tax=Hydrocarboniphaga daqingensis TaxID=490188 RepID=UPI000933B8C5|nr:hypothetical protein [Hydrocarboniphaga daqingensis]